MGIGTTNPAEKFQVAGIIYSTTGEFKFIDGTIQITAATGGDGGDDDREWSSGSGLTGDIYQVMVRDRMMICSILIHSAKPLKMLTGPKLLKPLNTTAICTRHIR